MNKIKIIYDVVRKMKDKDSIKGTFKAEGLENGARLFCINNTFERSNQDGKIKGKTNIEADCHGNKIRLENSIDFEGEGCHGHHNFMKCMRSFHKHHHAAHACCLKDGLNKIAAVLGILSSIKLDENEDGSVILSLVSGDIPEDIKNTICEKLKHQCECHKDMDTDHQHHKLMMKFHNMENTNFALNVLINNDSEIEKVTIDVNGGHKDENSERHEMKLSAELCLE